MTLQESWVVLACVQLANALCWAYDVDSVIVVSSLRLRKVATCLWNCAGRGEGTFRPEFAAARPCWQQRGVYW